MLIENLQKVRMPAVAATGADFSSSLRGIRWLTMDLSTNLPNWQATCLQPHRRRYEMIGRGAPKLGNDVSRGTSAPLNHCWAGLAQGTVV